MPMISTGTCNATCVLHGLCSAVSSSITLFPVQTLVTHLQVIPKAIASGI